MPNENKNLTPVWICYVDGKRLDTRHEGALKKIHVDDLLNSVGQCTLLFDISAEKLLELGTFSLESRISIHLGYKDDVEEVFEGEITGFSGMFMENGHEMAEVHCCNSLHKLAHGKHFSSFENKTCSEAIKDIIESYSLSAETDTFGPAQAFENIQNLTDLEYIKLCSEKYGKDFYAHGSKVYIKDNIQVRSDDIIFEWGKSLISFRAKQSIEKLYSACRCVGWNSLKCEGISAEARTSDVAVKVGGGSDWTTVSKGGDGMWIHCIMDQAFLDEEDAKSAALGALQRNSYNFITAEGKAEGTHKLLPGMRVNIKYVGSLFEGEYIAERVIHQLDTLNGYTTSFYLKRNMCP